MGDFLFFLVVVGGGGSERLPGWFLHISAHIGNVKKQMKKIASEKNAPICLFDRGADNYSFVFLCLFLPFCHLFIYHICPFVLLGFIDWILDF